MSGVGIPQSGLSGVLNLVRPDLAAEQMALQRRQAFAQSLLGQQPQYTGVGGAIDNVGSKILGALLSRNADKQNLDIANKYRDALFNPQGAGGNAPMLQGQPSAATPPLASLPQSIAPIPGQISSEVQRGPLPPLGSMSQGGLQAPPQPPTPPMAPQQPMGQQPQSSAQSLFDQAVPDIPGIDPRNKFVLYASDPAAYLKAYYDRTGQTNEYKNALAAAGGDPQAAQQLMQAQATKAGTLEFREKGFGVLPNGKTIYGPNEESNTYFTTGQNNEPIAHAIPGGAAVAAEQAAQIEHAKEVNKILPDVELSTGAKVPMFAGQAVGEQPQTSQGAPPLGIRSNNPGNLQPGGKEASYASPQEGIGAMSNLLSGPIYHGKNTVSQIVSTYAPPKDGNGKSINDTAGYIADVAARMGVKPNQQIDLNDPETKAMLMHSMIQHENGMQPYGQKPSQGAPVIGEGTAQKKINEAHGEAASSNAHVQASSDALIKAIDGMIAMNDSVPDSTFLSPDVKARINEFSPGLPGFKGDSGALHQWEQLNSIGILGGIKNLGMGRTDIPIVKQVVAGGGIPANIPTADRLKLLQTLKTEVINNRAAAQNTVSNLNDPNAATPGQAPMQTYNTGTKQQKIRHYNPATGRLE